jgi:tetratricopeptide (TPR) repeat protein
MKQQHVYFFFLLVLLTGIGFLSGCSSSKPTSSADMGEQAMSVHEREARHDFAVQNFIEGAALDAKGAYADAVLQYQDAIQAEPNAALFYAISRDYALLGKHARAIETAREAVRLEPNNISFHESLAAIYVNAMQPALAIHEYEAILNIDSTQANSWLALAHLYQATSPQKSIEIYERLLNQDDSNLDNLFQCANIYGSLGEYDKAITKYKRMLELDPSNRPLQKQLAEIEIKAGHLEDAKAVLETMMILDPSDPEVAASLADVYLSKKEYQQATKLYERLLNQGIVNPEIKLRIGIGFFGQTERDSTFAPRALALFKEVEQASPTDWRPLWYLGALAANQHNDSLAASYFDRVTKLAAWNGDAWWFLGTSLFDQGKYEQLLSTMAQAEKSVPKDFRVYLLQGLAYTRLEKQELAVQKLQQAHTLNPKDMNTLSTLAMTLDGLHRYIESDKLYEEALLVDPKSALLLNNYGYSLSERGLQLDRALQMAQQAITAEPNNAAYLDTYGWVLFKLARYEDAVTYIEKAISIGNASAAVVEHLGDVYFKLGKHEQAMEMWKKALGMDEKNTALREKITRGSL